MNILVTGGAGYIGSVTVEQLIEQDYRVVVIDSMERGHKKAVHPDATLVEGNIGSKKTVADILRNYDIDAVMHFAADSLVGESMENPAKYFHNNVTCGLTLMHTAAEHGVKRFILSSTAATYGEPNEIPIPETHPNAPTNPYGESKLMLEKILKWFYQSYGMQYTALRYFNACGASKRFGEDHDPETHLIPLVLDAATGKRKFISVFGDDYPTPDGTCIRDYIHVIDLAKAHILALNTDGSGIFNLGNGQGFSVKEVIAAVELVTGKKIAVKIAPRRAGDPARLVASSEKAQKELGWKPLYPSLEDMVGTAWKWKCANPEGYKDK
ncbi:MAG: UDP-glucose 4-epimerase GalE [Candidatus Auribacterota bacterium]|jgi:UDP-glucose 4-epimerase|nr:UDP-glucose 4-epimerase GalE [Candidatus Auribacterota bacterium]